MGDVVGDVPDDALAVERNATALNEGWGHRFRDKKLANRKPKT